MCRPSLYGLAVLLAAVTGAAAISFRVEPTKKTVVLGQSTLLRCQVDNQDGISVYWQNVVTGEYLSVDRKVDPFGRLSDSMRRRYRIVGDSGAGEYNLMIRRISMSDDTRYACVYFTETAYYSQVVRIRVLKPPDKGFPSCLLGPKLQMEVGDNITLVCESMGGDPPATLTWIRGEEILESTFTPHASRTVSGYQHTLRESDRNVRFTCVARNQALAQPRSCYVIPLRTRIEVMIRPAVTTIYLGDSISFHCISENVPRLAYRWTVNGLPVAEDDPHYKFLRGGTRLRVVNATAADDASVVVCHVEQEQLGLASRAMGQLWVRRLSDNLPEFTSAVLTTAPATTTPMPTTAAARLTTGPLTTTAPPTATIAATTPKPVTTPKLVTTPKPVTTPKSVTTPKPITTTKSVATTKPVVTTTAPATATELLITTKTATTAPPVATTTPVTTLGTSPVTGPPNAIGADGQADPRATAESDAVPDNAIPGMPGTPGPFQEWDNNLSGLSEKSVTRPNPNVATKTSPSTSPPPPPPPGPKPRPANKQVGNRPPSRGDVPIGIPVTMPPPMPVTPPPSPTTAPPPPPPTTTKPTRPAAPAKPAPTRRPPRPPGAARPTAAAPDTTPAVTTNSSDPLLPTLSAGDPSITEADTGGNAGLAAGLSVTFILLALVAVGAAVYFFKFRKPPQK